MYIFSIIYDKDNKDLIIKSFSDSNWGKDHNLKKSIFRFIFILNKKSVNQYLKKQAIIALTSTTAKNITLISIIKKAI